MKKLTGKKIVGALVASILAVAAPTPSHADPLVELGLAIDVSGSITGANFTLQKNAYLNVLNNVAILPRDGTVAVGVISFSTAVHQIFPTTVITQSTIGALISAIQTNLTDLGGSTAIGDAIAYMSGQLLGNTISSQRQVIDVSTDGDGNVGVNQITAANAAIAAGIDDINCLGIGTSARCNFVRGPNSFSINATNFAAFETSLERKIAREINPVPEPTSIALLALGVVGVLTGRSRRKRGA